MPSSSLHLPSTAGKWAIPSVPRLGGTQSIYISNPDKDLFFCSMFNRSFTSLGERTASSLRMRLSSARASLWLLFDLFFRFDNLHIYERPVQQEHAQISQNYSDTWNCSNQELAPLTELYFHAEQHTCETSHSPGHCYLCTNTPGHAQICGACVGRRARHRSLEFIPSFLLTASFQICF